MVSFFEKGESGRASGVDDNFDTSPDFSNRGNNF